MGRRGKGRPTGGYRLADGTRVPSVTTITGRFKDSGGLIRWAYRCGQDGVDMDAAKQDAGDAGSIVHAWIEEDIHGLPLHDPSGAVDSAIVSLAERGWAAYVAWRDIVRLDVVESETPLVSERYRYGGTLDLVARVSGNLALLDWKTSGKAYPDYIAQVAAYRELVRERGGDDAAPREAYLLRVGKTHGDFHFHFYPAAVLDLGWGWFSRARELYELDRELKRVAA